MSIRITFTPTPQDYINTVRYMQSRRWQTWVSLAVLLASSLMALLVLSTGPTSKFLPVLILLAFPLFAGYLFYWQPNSIGQIASRNERLTSETTWEVTDKGILFSNAPNQTKSTWDEFKKAEEISAYFMLIPAGKNVLYRFVPKRAFTTSQQEASFREILKQKLPEVPKRTKKPNG